MKKLEKLTKAIEARVIKELKTMVKTLTKVELDDGVIIGYTPDGRVAIAIIQLLNRDEISNELKEDIRKYLSILDKPLEYYINKAFNAIPHEVALLIGKKKGFV